MRGATPPAPPTPPPQERAEYKTARERLSKRLRADKVALFPSTLDGLALVVLEMIDEDRQVSSILVGKAQEQFEPLDDEKVRRLQQVIESRQDLGKGRVQIGDFILDLTK